jgi:hypothetical protein
MHQAVSTAHDYFTTLRRMFPDLTADQIIRLCDVAARDFHTAIMARQMILSTETVIAHLDDAAQRQLDSDDKLTDALDRIAEAMPD